MRALRLLPALAGLMTVWTGQPFATAAAQQVQAPGYQDPAAYQDYPMEARIWLDRGNEPVLQRGERVRIYYRVSEGAFVAIFHIDANGTARMIFPSSPQENHYARAGRDYRVLFPGSSYWYVNDDPGMGYFFIVASPYPFDFTEFRYSHYAGGWDLSYVGRQVYGDPYLAMDDYVGALIPDWEYVAYGLDFTAYHVERHYEYPRFLCYDCHGFRPYYTWNPYAYHCSSYRVLIYNDPYYYPMTRYRGTRVVYVQPRRGVAHFGFKERAAGEAGTPQVIKRTAPPVSQPGVEGTQNRRAVPRSGSTVLNSPGTENRNGAATGQTRPGVEGTTNRRSGGATPGSPTSPGRTTPGGVEGRPTVVPLTSPRSPKENAPGDRSRIIRRLTDPAPKPGGAERPTLERRTNPARGAAPPKVTTPPARPSSKVRKPGSGGRGTGGGGATTARPPTRGTGGGGAASSRLPTIRSSGSSSTTRRPATTSRGSVITRPPPTRSSGGSVGRAPTRSSGGGAVTSRPPTVRRSGGGATTSRPPTRTTPPPRRRTTGGGGGGGG